MNPKTVQRAKQVGASWLPNYPTRQRHESAFRVFRLPRRVAIRPTRVMPKIAFLGAGRMASAIVDGLLATKVSAPAELACVDGGDDTARQLAARTGIGTPGSLEALFQPADTIVLACKP